ncbi:MAG TPA: putative quinol monooxygenase [Candidatus Dormibacteraeota bacterium]|nr:putative quinol monooxygenase [Candidatus Dormibacteraeota bacterium]
MSEPITIVARFRAKAGREARLRQLLQGLIEPTRAEAGCLLYDLHQSQSDPAQFLFYEIWKCAADVDAHFQTPHLQAMLQVVPELLEEPLDVTRWTRL